MGEGKERMVLRECINLSVFLSVFWIFGVLRCWLMLYNVSCWVSISLFGHVRSTEIGLSTFRFSLLRCGVLYNPSRSKTSEFAMLQPKGASISPRLPRCHCSRPTSPSSTKLSARPHQTSLLGYTTSALPRKSSLIALILTNLLNRF